jgi:hypothetical protein
MNDPKRQSGLAGGAGRHRDLLPFLGTFTRQGTASPKSGPTTAAPRLVSSSPFVTINLQSQKHMKKVLFGLLTIVVALLAGCAMPKQYEMGKCMRCKQYANEVPMQATRVGEVEFVALCSDCYRQLTPTERLPYYQRLYDFYEREYPLSLTNVSWAAVQAKAGNTPQTANVQTSPMMVKNYHGE